jgi:hypothetical protein
MMIGCCVGVGVGMGAGTGAVVGMGALGVGADSGAEAVAAGGSGGPGVCTVCANTALPAVPLSSALPMRTKEGRGDLKRWLFRA